MPKGCRGRGEPFDRRFCANRSLRYQIRIRMAIITMSLGRSLTRAQASHACNGSRALWALEQCSALRTLSLVIFPRSAVVKLIWSVFDMHSRYELLRSTE